MTVNVENIWPDAIAVEVFRDAVIDSADAMETWLRVNEIEMHSWQVSTLGGMLHPQTGMPCARYRFVIKSETDAIFIKTALG